ncbi:MAG: SH3 domain-containing protein [Nitrosomonadales bacterium]|nr:SH3 domain-containing protein [Nitrosomonadales bacterium]
MGIKAAAALSATLLAAAYSLHAAEYVSVAGGPAILYDAPSLKAKKLFVASRYLPLEQIVSLDNWIKVRDSSGGLAWIEKRAVSGRRFVEATADLTAMRQAPEENAAVLAQIKKRVALERLENTGSGWLKVRHQDGVTGYVRMGDVWGG